MVNYCIYVNRSPVPVLSRLNPTHVPIQFLEDPIQYYPPIYAQVLQLVFSVRVPHLNPVCNSSLPLSCYMHQSSLSS